MDNIAPKLAGINLTTNPPHNTRIEVNFGRLSILFSYGSVIGYDYLDGPKVLDGLNRHQRKHTNQWRRFDKQEKLPFPEFSMGYLIALNQESEQLINVVLPSIGELPMEESNEQVRRSPVDEELDRLDALENEDDEGEDEDLDDDLLGEDDDLDDDDDDDDLDDDDDEDDDLWDDDDEDDDDDEEEEE